MTGTATEAIYITASSSRFKFIMLRLQFCNVCIDLKRLKNCKQYAALRTPVQILRYHVYLLNI